MIYDHDPPPEVRNLPRLVPPEPGPAFLVRLPDTEATRTTVFEADAVASMQRGLKEYLERLSSQDSGAEVRFRSVDMTWAEPNEPAEYPAAAILLEGNPEYEADNLTPRVFEGDRMPDGSYVEKRSEVTALFRIVAHTATPGERDLIARMLEDALAPVDWMYGFYVELPHYGGQRATFLPVRADYRDSAELARHGLRPVEVFVEGRVAEVVVRRPPTLQAHVIVRVDDPTDPAPANPGRPRPTSPVPPETAAPTVKEAVEDLLLAQDGTVVDPVAQLGDPLESSGSTG